MEFKVHVSVEIDGKQYVMDRNAEPTEGCYVIITNAGSNCGGDVPYDNLDVFQVKKVQYDKRYNNNVSGVEVVEPHSYFSTLPAGDYAVLIPVST